MGTYDISPSWQEEVKIKSWGSVPSMENSSIGTDLIAWNNFKPLLEKSVKAGQTFSNGVVSTYSLVYIGANVYAGGVLAPNGDIHFVPANANRGQKVSINGTVSTYSLVYIGANVYTGGVLATNGDIHFIPYAANRGQKVAVDGTVSTYSLVYTTSYAYGGGVLAPNGDIHFVPLNANRGQKVSTLTGKPFNRTICESPFFNKL